MLQQAEKKRRKKTCSQKRFEPHGNTVRDSNQLDVSYRNIDVGVNCFQCIVRVNFPSKALRMATKSIQRTLKKLASRVNVDFSNKDSSKRTIYGNDPDVSVFSLNY